MRPLSEIAQDALIALEGVCFDVDDTVTTAGVLDPQAYAALFSLQSVGLKLVAVTGRPLGFAVDCGSGCVVAQLLAALLPAKRSAIQLSACGAAWNWVAMCSLGKRSKLTLVPLAQYFFFSA